MSELQELAEVAENHISTIFDLLYTAPEKRYAETFANINSDQCRRLNQHHRQKLTESLILLLAMVTKLERGELTQLDIDFWSIST